MVYNDEKLYQRRLRDRFPQHTCELPFSPDRVFATLPPVPSVSQRLRFWTQHLVVAWRRHPYLRLLRPSNFTVDTEQAKHMRNMQWWLIHPMSRFWMYWLLLVTITNVTLLFVLPFEQAFLQVNRYIMGTNTSTRTLPYVVWLDEDVSYIREHSYFLTMYQRNVQIVTNTCNALFYVHIIFKFFVGFYDFQHNAVVMSHTRIMKRYLRTWFFPELIAVIPVEDAGRWTTFFNQETMIDYMEDSRRIALYLYTLCYTLRLVRLHDGYHAIRIWCAFYKITPIITDFIIYFLIYILFIQWTSFYMVRVAYLVNGPYVFGKDSLSWVSDPLHQYLNVNRTWPLARQYFSAMHRVFHASACFSPHSGLPTLTTEDTAVMLVAMWLLLYFNIWLVALIMRYTETGHLSFLKLCKVFDQLFMYSRARNWPTSLRTRILMYYNYRYDGDFYNEHDILHNMPINVRKSIRVSFCRKVVVMSSFFQGVPRALLNSIAANMEEEWYMPHDVVYASDSEASYLYFLSIGTVAIYLRTGEEVGHLCDGDYFGEMGVVLTEHNESHMESVVALEMCQVFKLSRRVFWRLIKPMPRLANRLRAAAMLRAEDVAQMFEKDQPGDVLSESLSETSLDDDEELEEQSTIDTSLDDLDFPPGVLKTED